MTSVPDDNDRLRAHGKGRLVEMAKGATERPPKVSNLQRDDAWRSGLTFDSKRKLEATAGNLELLLCHLPEWRGVLAFDEMSYRPIWAQAPPLLPGYESPALGVVGDTDWVLVQSCFRHELKLKFERESIETAIARVARRNPRHAIREYLDSLNWDGTSRLDLWLVRYLGADDSLLTRAFGAKTLIAAVARVYRPGAKLDTMLVLEGGQGIRKSLAIRALVPNEAWFDDDLPDLGDKDAMLHLRGLWLVEVAELDALKGQAETRVKKFLSKQADRCRPPYGRHSETVQRTCIFIGTTNNDQYLHDPTGGRRFWPVKVTKADIGALEDDHDQLWAEAKMRYRNGEPCIWMKT